jgi:lipid A 4'-phosphatase
MDYPANMVVWRRRLASVLALAGFCWFMRMHPMLDLASSAAFFDEGRGQFLLQANSWATAILDALQLIGRALPVAVLMILIVASIPSVAHYFPCRSVLLYLLLSSILVPGLLVNGLKTHYGRARPQQIQEFGGSSFFTPALVVSDQCSKNCSFVSGDAAEGFVPLAIALVARKRRQTLINIAMFFGVAVAVAKVMQGRHFLSDVVVASALTVGLNYELYIELVQQRSKGLPTERSLSR